MSAASNRNRDKFDENGFLYVFDKYSTNGMTKFWRCEDKNKGCKARIHEENGIVTKRLGVHSHAPNPGRIYAVKAVSAMKRRASEMEESTSNVIINELQNVSQQSQLELPPTRALKQRIRRVRQKLHKEPVNPSSLSDLVLPESYTVYCPTPGVNENFVVFDSGAIEERILIFGRPRAAESEMSDLSNPDSTSIIFAFLSNDMSPVRRILEKRPRTKEVNDLKWALLDIVFDKPNMSFQHFLALSDSPVFDVDARTHEDATGLHFACSNFCAEHVGRWLQPDGDPREKTLEIYSALYYAVRINNLRIVETFLNNVENINLKGFRGCTALHMSAKFGHFDVCRNLLENGADPRLMNDNYELPLHSACKDRHADIAHLLVRSDLTIINHQDSNEMTPLMRAADNGDLECVRVLLENGAKIECCNSIGQMALHFVAEKGNAELLELMLQYTDTSSVEEETLNFLRSRGEQDNMISLTCCAIRSGNIKCMELLVTSKFSRSFLQTPQMEDNFGFFTPLAYLFRTFQFDHEKLKAFLQVLVKHKITMVHDYFRVKEKCAHKLFFDPFLLIFQRDLPFSKKEFLYNLFVENDISIDYCLDCCHDNSRPFSSSTYHLEFYSLFLKAFFAQDLENMKLVMSNSVILEPDRIIAELNSTTDMLMAIAGPPGKALTETYKYLMSLKPVYFIKPHPVHRIEYPYSSLQEEFAESTLQQLCRTVIRRQLRDYTFEDNLRNFKRKIMELPLPTLLKDYLLFK